MSAAKTSTEQVVKTAVQGTDSSPSLSLRYFSISLVAFLIACGLFIFGPSGDVFELTSGLRESVAYMDPFDNTP